MRLTTASLAAAIILPVFLATACSGGGRPDADADGVLDIPDGDVAEQADTTGDGGEDQPEAGCASYADCNDGDPCTTDTCDTDSGECGHDPVDGDADGYAAISVDGGACGGTDCDDSNPDSYPGAAPGCAEALDLDCDSLPDVDEDGDGHSPVPCGGDDCDDSDPLAYSGSAELDCGGLDRDCNGTPDHDNDGDGQDARSCAGGLDCDDGDATVHWSAVEDPCDGKDTNCNGIMDAIEDRDGDDFANEACAAPGREVDCDDGDGGIHPGADEACDLVDSDCDGSWADAGADDDGDGRLDESCGGDDCDDAEPTTWIGAPEICDGAIDQDCDGLIDEPSPVAPEVEVSTVVPGLPEHPSVAWSGSELGIAFKDLFEGSSDIWFARMSPDGSSVGSASRITSDPYYSGEASLSWSGSEYGVAYMDNRYTPNYEIYFARISMAGAKLGSEIRVTNDAGLSHSPSIAWSGSAWAIAWTDDGAAGTEILLCFLDPEGSKLGSDLWVTADPSVQRTASLVRAGSGLGLAWEDDRDGNYEIYFRALDGSGSPAGGEIRVTDDPLESAEPSVAWTGSGFGLAWRADRAGCEGVGFAALEPDGTPLGSVIDVVPSCTCGSCVGPSIAWAGSGFGVIWSDYTFDADGETAAAVIGPLGSPVSVRGLVTSGGYPFGSNSLAWTGSGFGAAWREFRAASYGIWATFFKACE